MSEKIKFNLRELFARKYVDIFLVSLAAAMGAYLRWDAADIVILGFFTWSVLNSLAGRSLMAQSIFFLAFIPFFLVFQKKGTTDQIVIYAYYLLMVASFIMFKKLNFLKLNRNRMEAFLLKKRLDILFSIAGAAMGAYLGWGIVESIIFGIFIWIILNPLASKIIIIPALAFLALTSFSTIFNKNGLAEQFAIYAYYFLAMAVFMGIYELRREKSKEDNA